MGNVLKHNLQFTAKDSNARMRTKKLLVGEDVYKKLSKAKKQGAELQRRDPLNQVEESLHVDRESTIRSLVDREVLFL